MIPRLASLVLALVASPVVAHAESTLEYITVDSKAVHKSVRVGVYLPDGYEANDARFPVLYFLHGMFGNERKWENRGVPDQLDELIAQKKVPPMIVVCPNGENSMYVNWVSGKADWEIFIADELPKAIDAKYRTIAGRTGRGISGDSMGGFGALNIAFHHPDEFASVSAHSAALFAVDPNNLSDRMKQMAARWKDVFGAPVDVKNWERNNPLKVAETADADALKSLTIYFDCGNHDHFGFDQTNVELHQELEKRGIPHQWTLRDGDHGDEYFRANVCHSLEFHGAAFAAVDTKADAKTGPNGKDAKRDV